MSEPTLKLPSAAEALLADFPMTEPDFEAQAKAIAARLASAASGAAVDDLFKAPPLAPEPGEPGAPSSVRTAPAPKSSFAEMARRSMQKNDVDDVDAAQLAKELLAVTAQSRRPNQELVERVRAAGRATATPLPVESAEEPARPSGVVTRAAAPVVTANFTTKAPIHRGTIIGIAGALVAIAAGVALFLGADPSESPTAALIADPREPATPKVTAPEAAPSTLAVKPSDIVSLDALAPAPEHPAAEAPKPVAAKSTTGAASPSSKPSAAASAVAHLPGEVGEAPQPARGVTEAKPEAEPALKPAEGSSGSVPITPSAGAVSTALGAVRSSAQACLAGQTEPVSATVTFAADGHVLRVSAGGPAGSCIQAALSKARIAPFARETFSASTTVRPP